MALRHALVAISLLVLRGIAPGQSTVDPDWFRYAPGGRETGYPFGYAARAVHYQEIHDGLAGTARSIRRIAFRRAAASTGKVAAFQTTCTLRLATAPHPAAKIDANFAANLGTDLALVLDRTSISFPETTAPTSVPAFEFALPLDKPFVFGGKGPLALDLLVHASTNKTSFTFDLYQEGRSHAADFGDGCHRARMQTALMNDVAVHSAGGMPPLAPALLLVGRPRAPLPLDTLGAPGCASFTTILATLPAWTDRKGKARLAFDLSGASPGDGYACQMLGMAPGVNPLGAVFSGAGLVLPAGARDTGRVFADSLTATKGTAQPVYGLVLEVQ